MSGDEHPPRSVTLVLCTPDGELLGCLPPFEAPFPWWPDARDVIARARAAHGVDVRILRLLSAAGPQPGGPVAYLAELAGSPRRPIPALAPWAGDPIRDHPLRMPWARPGGPGAELAWADAALRAAGHRRTGEPAQQRTWNLSSIWRIPTDHGDAWLKSVPPFFAHEGGLIGRLADAARGDRRTGITPPLLAHEGHRVLLADIPGADQYDAAPAALREMIEILVALQTGLADPAQINSLLAIGLPDWRRDPLRRRAERVLAQYGAQLEAGQRRTVEDLIARWDERFAAIQACGLPDTLIHGDFHPGNVRGEAGRLVILDWGDSGIGHPMLDQPAMLDRTPAPARAALIAHWGALWRAAVPGSDPDRAAALLRPVAALREASVYLGFLDAIEPDERVYHAADPLAWLRRAASS